MHYKLGLITTLCYFRSRLLLPTIRLIFSYFGRIYFRIFSLHAPEILALHGFSSYSDQQCWNMVRRHALQNFALLTPQQTFSRTFSQLYVSREFSIGFDETVTKCISLHINKCLMPVIPNTFPIITNDFSTIWHAISLYLCQFSVLYLDLGLNYRRGL